MLTVLIMSQVVHAHSNHAGFWRLDIYQHSDNSVYYEFEGKNMAVKFPSGCTPSTVSSASGTVKCTRSLTGKTIYIYGLYNSPTDIVAKVVTSSRQIFTEILSGANNSITVKTGKNSRFFLSVHTANAGLIILLFLLVFKTERAFFTASGLFILSAAVLPVLEKEGLLKIDSAAVYVLAAMTVFYLSIEYIRSDKQTDTLLSLNPGSAGIIIGAVHGAVLFDRQPAEETIVHSLLFTSIFLVLTLLMAAAKKLYLKNLPNTAKKYSAAAKTVTVYLTGSWSAYLFLYNLSLFYPIFP